MSPFAIFAIIADIMSNVEHMATLTISNLDIKANEHIVVENANILVHGGELHVLMGPNGSGKSSLLNAIMGHPKFKITGGKILLDGADITALPTEEKARRGIFLSLQHLPEIPGVTLTNFLYKAYRTMAENNPQFSGVEPSNITPLDFYHMMEARAKEFGIDPAFLKKELHTGLSGGEKKLSEALQLIALRPCIALLDEIDSGVDVDALAKIFHIVEHLKAKGTGFLIVSHHPHLLKHIAPDAVAVMKGGKIVATGGRELAERIAAEGFRDV